MDDFKVELPKTFHKISDNNCSLIGVNPVFKEIVHEQTFWSNCVAFETFNLKRGQDFLDNPRHENTGLLNSSFKLKTLVQLTYVILILMVNFN